MLQYASPIAVSDQSSAPPLADPAPLPQRIAAIAAARPEAVALRASCGALSYGELDRLADRLAGYLARSGVRAESIVAVCMPRSFEQIAALLAVMKAGGAFLPLDPSWPTDRLHRLIDDAEAVLLIADEEQAQRLASDRRPCLCPRRDAAAIGELSAPANTPRPEHLAYLIYTSGSTGEPKGVEITHGNLQNLIDWHGRAFDVTAADRASHLAGLGFDAAVWEVWPYLAVGASISLVPEAVRSAPDLLRDWLIAEKITIGFVPTRLAESLIAAEWPSDAALRALLIGAEAAQAFPPPGLPFQVVNNYGPTECSVVATSCVLPPQASANPGLPPIGRPIDNLSVHLLDEAGKPVAPGEIGEIHIGGAGVGRGYRHRPALTASVFLPDPFASEPGVLLYRTGDLGRTLPDGQIAFCGRRDEQEKIRGHRVEPGEIACVLNRHETVLSSVVLARGPDHDRHLVAYLLLTGAEPPTAETLRAHLAETLPDYMIPASFVRLDTLPLTASGKIDKQALPEPSAANSLERQLYRAPETPLEQRLATIVAEVLGAKRVGSDDNFFLMGGHSLLGTQVILRTRDAFGVDLTLLHLFESPTVAKLASSVERMLVEKLVRMSDEEAARQLGR
jgi:amino acid adenylation domain-containing protein